MPLSIERQRAINAYTETGFSLWTPELVARATALKPYIDRKFILDWNLVVSPSLEQMRKAGPPDGEFKNLGLLTERDEGSGVYPHFRDRIVIPCFEKGSINYLVSRRISDTDPGGKPLPKQYKALSMHGEPNGLPRPDGFNLDVLDDIDLLKKTGVWVVEAPLEAAYCTSIGQPTVAFIGGALETNKGIIKRLQILISWGVTVYVSLDGTADINEERRAVAAGAIHPKARICILTDNKDPDDYSIEEIRLLNDQSKLAVSTWLSALSSGQDLVVKGKHSWAHDLIGPQLKQWRGQTDEHELKLLDRDIATALGMLRSEYVDYVAKLGGNGKSAVKSPGKAVTEPIAGAADTIMLFEDPEEPVVIEPPEIDPDFKEPIIRNYTLYEEQDDKGKVHMRKKIVKLPVIANAMKLATDGWPRSASGFLFWHDKTNDEEPIKVLGDKDDLFSYLHGFTVLRWDGGLDRKGRTLLTKEEFFRGVKLHVHQHDGVEICPHEPPLPNYYYAYTPDPDYVPDGSYLKQLLEFFQNADTTGDRQLIKALFMTPMAGLKWDRRPGFAITAGDRNCGKSTLAEAVGKLYGEGIDIRLSRDPERDIYSRLLAPNNIYKRVVRVDNVKGLCSSTELESILTSSIINGHRMHKGDACRPNNLTFIITGNALTLSSDISRRVFQIHLAQPTESGAWQTKLFSFIHKNRKKIYADIIQELRKPPSSVDVSAGTGGWAGWSKLVLGHCKNADEVLAITRDRRKDADEEVEEAISIMEAIAAAVEEWHDYHYNHQNTKMGIKPQLRGDKRDTVFISSRDMATILNRTLTTRFSPSRAARRIKQHVQAKRLPSLQIVHEEKQRGYLIVLETPLPEHKAQPPYLPGYS